MVAEAVQEGGRSGKTQVTMAVEQDAPEKEIRVQVRLEPDDPILILAERYGLPKAQVLKEAAYMTTHSVDESLDDRLQAIVDARKAREAERNKPVPDPVEARSELPQPGVEPLESHMLAIRERFADMEREQKMQAKIFATIPGYLEALISQSAALADGVVAVGKRLDLIENSISVSLVQPDAQHLAGAEGASASSFSEVFGDTLRDVLQGIQSIGQQVGLLQQGLSQSAVLGQESAMAPVDLSTQFNNLRENIEGMLGGLAEQLSGILRMPSLDGDNSGSINRVVSMLGSMSADISKIQLNLQPSTQGSGESASAVILERIQGLESQVGSLISEASAGFHLEASKPIGKAFMGKLLVVRDIVDPH
ncbi:hypothetical protein JKG47_09375 [Acidithiobacillus sp. MC6.1]|nr:hypothetical protein [Acidithiobacillus sp. MC6.1]